jgi:hypothetical protein
MISEIYKKYSHKIHPNIEGLKLARYFRAGLKKIVFYRMENFDREEKKEMQLKEKNWRNLIILDACRHDLFECVMGDTDFRYSPGSNSAEFIMKNFSEGDWSDVVYVTANPHFHESHFKELTGKKSEDVFHTVFHSYEDKWNDKEATVMPKDLMEDFETARKLFPDKKIILHFMQPHYPFVKSNIDSKGIKPDLNHKKEELSAWDLAERGEFSKEEVWNAYQENLEFVLDEVMEELEKLEQRTVITSDHGNFVGEKGFYGHPYNVHAEPLIKVPWFVVGESK